jgi:hypothetical protein
MSFFIFIFGGFYHDEDDQLEDEEPKDGIANYEEDDIADNEEVDEDLSGEAPNFNTEEVDYVDFLGVENILNFPHDDYGEFCADEKNYMFTRETMTYPFLSIFRAHGREKERQKNDKSEVFPSGVWNFHNNHQGIPMMRSITLIFWCCLVLILRNGEWNELIGHPKNRRKNWPNLTVNSLKPGENYADRHPTTEDCPDS